MQGISSVTPPVQDLPYWSSMIGAKMVHIQCLISEKQEIEKNVQLSTTSSLETTKEISSLHPVHQLIFLSQHWIEQIVNEVESLYAHLNITHKEIETQLNVLKATVKISSVTPPAWEHSSSRLVILQAALSFLRQQKNYTGEYLVRKFFIHLVHLTPSSVEECRKAIELEQEHLDTLFFFSDQPGNDQEKYNFHLSGYLFLLARHFGLMIEKQQLNEQLPEVLNHLNHLLSQESKWQAADVVLIRRTLAFFQSRPEWFFRQDFSMAKYHLKQAKQQEEDKALKNKIELQFLTLEINQATRFKEGHREDLLDLLKQLQPLLKELGPSPSDTLIAFSAGAKIYEFLAREASEPEKLIKKLLSSLSYAIKIGDQLGHLLDFKALQALAACRFLFGFYSCLCFKTKEEYKEGLTALLKVSQDFWVDKQTKHAADLLNECLPSIEKLPDPLPLKKESFFTLVLFKLMLQKRVCQLYHNHKGVMQFKQGSVVNEESSIWNLCKHQVLSSFFKGNVEQMESIVNHYLLLHLKRTDVLIKPHYHHGAFRFRKSEIIGGEPCDSPSFLSSQEKKEAVLFMKAKEPQLSLNANVDTASLAQLLIQSKDYPLIGSRLSHVEFQLLENISTELSMQIKVLCAPKENPNLGTKETKMITFAPHSNLEWFYKIYRRVKALLKQCQGNLNYSEAISSTMDSYLTSIFCKQTDPLHSWYLSSS